MKKRNEIPIEETWNLQDLYSSEEDFNRGLQDLKEKAKIFNELSLEKESEKKIRMYEQILIQISRLSHYAELHIAAELTSFENAKRSAQSDLILQGVMEDLSRFESELYHLSDEKIELCKEQMPEYNMFFEKLKRDKKHRLSNETEEALASLNSSFSLAYTIYEQAKLGDMSFDDFMVEGKKYPLSFVLYENDYQLEANTKVRRQAFESFSKGLRKYHRTIGTAYLAQVLQEKKMATLRGFDSVIDYLLFDQQIDREIYEQHLDTIWAKLPAIFQKYAKLLKENYQLKELKYADLKLPLDPSEAPGISIEEAKGIVREATGIMGKEYSEIIERALENRWIDWAQNEGKSTGGFCATPYGAHSYVLLSWTSRLSEVFTLIHELGHVAHFTFAQKNPFLVSEPSLYFIEAPSTMNEILLYHYFSKQKAVEAKNFAISALLSNTYFHNFVTHFLEAIYQREVYRRIDKNNPLTPEDLNDIMKSTLEHFWGNTVILDEGAELTWMRQPHYYMGLYSYTYSAGLNIGTAMARKMMRGDKKAAGDWILALKNGGTKTAKELAQIAEIDIESTQSLEETMNFIESLFNSYNES